MSHHFTLVKETPIPELGSTARLYRHEITGARLLSIINDDENKCFSINFRTPPQRFDRCGPYSRTLGFEWIAEISG